MGNIEEPVQPLSEIKEEPDANNEDNKATDNKDNAIDPTKLTVE